jgi:hypothetical protein
MEELLALLVRLAGPVAAQLLLHQLVEDVKRGKRPSLRRCRESAPFSCEELGIDPEDDFEED